MPQGTDSALPYTPKQYKVKVTGTLRESCPPWEPAETGRSAVFFLSATSDKNGYSPPSGSGTGWLAQCWLATFWKFGTFWIRGILEFGVWGFGKSGLVEFGVLDFGIL